ncbi:uncharacterized protein [Spinacia oleracea]|uniref:Reverse transcriptase zinc-binding domain-containing protein n=1 Tax=Spinacia oleracea TaxID=3562 RepID=A0ABM3QXP1_SPIOL|nr:uncharacterized protein LOC130463113 [Spinacia oleracea]
MKGRQSRNSIDVLYDSSGKKLATLQEIKGEISQFYTGLIGTVAPSLVGIDVNIIRKGKQLSDSAANELIQPVTESEIDAALKGIDPNKAPGLDGFNSLFFLWAWDLLKDMSIRLMQKVIGDVISPSQAGFIPGRNISDNILLACELAKCYSRKNISPGCMLKVDMKKAYDSLEWSFLPSMLAELGFPTRFVSWGWNIYQDAWLISPVIKALNSTQDFSRASGLEANLHKSEVYLAGINDQKVDQVVDILGIAKGTFPNRYLGVPLTTRKLSYNEWKPLIEKTVTRIKGWSARLLSYAGRLQLIKSVLFGVQLYWCQIFVMPKKAMKEIQRLCRSCLWTGTDVRSKKAPIAWENLCLPKTCGGWNLKELTTWNKVAVLKHCWALSMKQDRLWVKWMHTYYIQQRDFWSMPVPNGLTWSMRKIWHQRDLLLQAGGGSQFVVAGMFKIHKAYKHLHQSGVQVPWKRLVCNSTFVVWLAVQNRLATKDRLIKWNMPVVSTCSLCDQHDEDLSHLFFSCKYSAEVWELVLNNLGIQRSGLKWKEEVNWAIKKSRSSRKTDASCAMAFIETVYGIWLQRNSKTFSSKVDPPLVVDNRILFFVACRQ